MLKKKVIVNTCSLHSPHDIYKRFNEYNPTHRWLPAIAFYLLIWKKKIVLIQQVDVIFSKLCRASLESRGILFDVTCGHKVQNCPLRTSADRTLLQGGSPNAITIIWRGSVNGSLSYNYDINRLKLFFIENVICLALNQSANVTVWAIIENVNHKNVWIYRRGLTRNNGVFRVLINKNETAQGPMWVFIETKICVSSSFNDKDILDETMVRLFIVTDQCCVVKPKERVFLERLLGKWKATI